MIDDSPRVPARACTPADLDAIYDVINDAAQAYRGIIPEDRWHEPYMSREELTAEIASGVQFFGIDDQGALAAVMGLQPVQDVALIRHAYTRTASQGHGFGAALLSQIHARADRPMLIGTWTAAVWAIRFYERHGFRLVPSSDTPRLLRQYWSIPDRQIETSVVLADDRWWSR